MPAAEAPGAMSGFPLAQAEAASRSTMYRGRMLGARRKVRSSTNAFQNVPSATIP
jgi:hypothetical protein